MTARDLSGLATVLALLVGLAGAAHAQQDRGDGFEAGLRIGYGLPLGKASDGADLNQGISGAVPLWLDLGYRAMPELFVGLYTHYGFGFVGDSLDPVCSLSGLDCSASDVRLGIQAHYHPAPRGSVDPWIGLGFGYEWSTWGASGGGVQLSITPSGFELVNLQLGLDVPVSKRFYLGPVISFSLDQFSSISVDCSGAAGLCAGFGVDGDIPNKALHEWLVIALRAAYAP